MPAYSISGTLACSIADTYDIAPKNYVLTGDVAVVLADSYAIEGAPRALSISGGLSLSLADSYELVTVSKFFSIAGDVRATLADSYAIEGVPRAFMVSGDLKVVLAESFNFEGVPKAVVVSGGISALLADSYALEIAPRRFAVAGKLSLELADSYTVERAPSAFSVAGGLSLAFTDSYALTSAEPRPLFAITKLTAPSTVYVGRAHSVGAHITNVGTAAGSFKFYITDERGNIVSTIFDAPWSLEPGQTATSPSVFVREIYATGRYTYKAVVFNKSTNTIDDVKEYTFNVVVPPVQGVVIVNLKDYYSIEGPPAPPKAPPIALVLGAALGLALLYYVAKKLRGRRP
jgi:hypothetical protein